MTLEVEDGTGKATAESYLSVADADAYFAARNLTLWDDSGFTDAEKEGCLRRATDYMRQVYRLRWTGQRVSTTQALDWPRNYVPIPDGSASSVEYYAEDAVPTEVEHACAELAWRAAFGELAPDLARTTRREKVDVIEVEYEPGSPWVRFRAVDMILAPVLKSSGSGASHGLVRV